jgi:hypothetical protein
LARQDIDRIVLDPARAREVLGEFVLGNSEDLAVVVEQHRAGTGGSLVE